MGNSGIKQLTDELLGKPEEPEQIDRQLIDTPYAVLVNNQLNQIYQERPAARKMLGVLSVYPLLKWSVEQNEVWKDSLNGKVTELGTLLNIQDILAEYGIEIPHIRLTNRNQCIKATEKILSELKKQIDRIRTYPALGEKYYHLLRAIHLSPDDNTVSRWLIKTHYKSALMLLADICENTINEILESTKPAKQDYHVDMYHNTKLLLMRYQRILWREGGPDKALQLLECDTLSDMMQITLNEKKYAEAANLIDYVKVVHLAIEQLQTYPEEGERLYLMTKHIYTNGNDKLEWLMEEFNCGKNTVYRLQKRAVNALSLILWGAATDNLFQLLAV